MTPRPIQGWPLWQRLNFFILTMAGGYAGFYIQHRYMTSHKAQLLETLPQLERHLADVITHRKFLETQLQSLKTHTPPQTAYQPPS